MRTTVAHTRQSRPDSGLGCQVRVLKTLAVRSESLKGPPSSLESDASQNSWGQAAVSRTFQPWIERLRRFEGRLPERHGQNLALTVSCVPYSLDRGGG